MPGCPNNQNVTSLMSDPESTSAHEVLCKTHRYMDVHLSSSAYKNTYIGHYFKTVKCMNDHSQLFWVVVV